MELQPLPSSQSGIEVSKHAEKPVYKDGHIESRPVTSNEKRSFAEPSELQPSHDSTQPILPAPIQITDDSSVHTKAVHDSAMPILAKDEDVISKDWVDKAKKIVNQTKEDPYYQVEEISKLQSDYVTKRY